jgi:pilus retraction protein PilT
MRESLMKKFETLVRSCVRGGFSDVHITGGHPIVYRKDGNIGFTKDSLYSPEEMDDFVSKILSFRQFEILRKRWSVDMAISVSNVRLRMNIFSSTRGLSMAVRILPGTVPSIADLNLHPSLQEITQLSSGLVLISGPTGSGKSTTAAAIISEMNNTLSKHIVTLEDPIEYRLVSKKSFVEQRELGLHMHSFEHGLIDVLREDPDVIVVGELRDPETIRLALNAAETGHLVIASLHSSKPEDAVYRMFNSFPPDAQEAVRTQLAATLAWLIVQHLERIPKAGFRMPVLSILRGTAAVKNIIRDNKLSQLESTLQTARGEGMFTAGGYIKDYIEKRTSFAPPAKVFGPSVEDTGEKSYYSRLLDADAPSA